MVSTADRMLATLAVVRSIDAAVEEIVVPRPLLNVMFLPLTVSVSLTVSCVVREDSADVDCIAPVVPPVVSAAKVLLVVVQLVGEMPRAVIAVPDELPALTLPVAPPGAVTVI